VSRDFFMAWGEDAILTAIATGAKPSPGHWQLVILDNSDQANALGYHDVTNEGLPIGKIFAKTDIDNGLSWSVTASHELLEMLGDPDINLTVFREDVQELWSYENCDACEADELGYDINGVLVSDFVWPSWFEGFWQPVATQFVATQFDQQNKITGPFQLLPGGYIGYYDLKGGSGWQQRTAQSTAKKMSMRAPVGSRRERRRIPRADWLRSVI
jgi:hypothetical protein